MLKVNNKDTRTTPLALVWCLYCLLWTYFTSCSSVSIVNFEHGIASWVLSTHFWYGRIFRFWTTAWLRFGTLTNSHLFEWEASQLFFLPPGISDTLPPSIVLQPQPSWTCVCWDKIVTIISLKMSRVSLSTPWSLTFKLQPYKIVRHTQTIHRHLSVFDHFVGLAFKGLTFELASLTWEEVIWFSVTVGVLW